MRIAFVVDPLADLKAYKDSSIAMMREAARRGHDIAAFEARSMFLREGSVRCSAQALEVHDDNERWYSPRGEPADARVADFDRVFMRKDPPFDQEYYYATLLLERAAAEGTTVVNDPRALRDWNEKLAILRFGEFTPATLVASDMARIHAFIDEHADVVVKKLDGMGGTMIFRVTASDPNRNVIVEAITDMGARTVMAQRYIPEIVRGDKRVLVIAGKPFSHCLARIPKAGETRGNLAAGGRGVAQPISARDREIGETVGRELVKAGIVFAGLDIIGDGLTEVNVTSPTCIVEIAQQTGNNAAVDLMDAVGV
ncbi:MAG TPA: glutathione synthase [Usitatibacter sp.]|nr:glutathione synthase [Usitatibacter sp.]